jgi:hypothetical protein
MYELVKDFNVGGGAELYFASENSDKYIPQPSRENAYFIMKTLSQTPRPLYR